MTQTKPKAQRAWAIMDAEYDGIQWDTIRRTRVGAIDAFISAHDYYGQLWTYFYRAGYRAVRVTITVEEE